VKGECGGAYGFVSSHAANSFNVALISLMFINVKWYSVSIIIWAALISYSRIYLGVHYPGDVLFGALLGSLIGWSMHRFYKAFDKKVLKSEY
jgi:undecaprenyl-diphosphatase